MGLPLTREGGHCGCCTYLAMMDPVLHMVVADQGAKLGKSPHCKCCRYLRSKGVHEDIVKANRYRRGPRQKA
ncbi:MAG TPA: hypothetical protein VIH83_06160 [Candidatus Bathyarchaeia archaeon]